MWQQKTILSTHLTLTAAANYGRHPSGWPSLAPTYMVVALLRTSALQQLRLSTQHSATSTSPIVSSTPTQGSTHIGCTRSTCSRDLRTLAVPSVSRVRSPELDT